MDPDELYAGYLRRQAHGEESSLDDLLAAHPEHAERLTELHRAYSELREVQDQMGFPDPASACSGESAPSLSEEKLDAWVAWLTERVKRLGPNPDAFVYLGKLGEGGFGRVEEIEQLGLDRRIARKRLLESGPHAAGGLRAQIRFFREARITGRLEHPGVPPVHSLGVDSHGRPFFTMAILRGVDLSTAIEWARSDREDWDDRRVVRVLVRVCETVAYAHSQGVVHRDLKPANVRVGSFGETYVMDWGLARDVGEAELEDCAPETDEGPGELHRGAREYSPAVTARDAAVGTPPYMAPEQAASDGVIGPATDVYAVGAILYQLLAGEPPYARPGEGLSPQAVRRRLREGPPTPLKELAPEASPDLIAICERAMAREPEQRYGDLLALGEDLTAFVERRVVSARERGLWPEVRKFVLRNPTLATALAMVFLLGAGMLSREYLSAKESARVATERRVEREWLSGLASLQAAQRLVELEDGPGAVRFLESCAPETRAWDWHYARAQADLSVASLGGSGEVVRLASGPYGEVFTGDSQGWVRIYGDDLGTAIASWRAGSGAVRALAVSPGGSRVAVATEAGPVVLCDEEGRLLRSLDEVESTTRELAFDPTGRFLAAACDDQSVRMWDLERDEPPLALWGHDSPVLDVTFDRHGTKLISASIVGLVRMWSVPTGEPLEGIDGLVAPTALAVSEAHDLLAVGLLDGRIGVWSLEAAVPKFTAELEVHRSGVRCLQFVGDGGQFLTGSSAGGLRHWSAEGKLLSAWIGHVAPVVDLAPAGGAAFVSVSEAGNARVWSRDVPAGAAVLAGHDFRVFAVAFDGRGRLFSGSADETARIWDVAGAHTERILTGHRDVVASVAVSADGEWVATGAFDGTGRIWEASTGAEIRRFALDGITFESVAFHPDGGRLLTGHNDGRARIWSLENGELESELEHSSGIVRAEFDLAGRRMFIVSEERVTVRDAETSEPVFELELRVDRLFPTAAFSPDGSQLAVGGEDGRIHLIDATGNELMVLEGHRGRVAGLAFHPTGERLVSAAFEGALRVWDLERETSWFLFQAGLVLDVAFSPDGRRFATAGGDWKVRLYEAVDPGELGGPRLLQRRLEARVRPLVDRVAAEVASFEEGFARLAERTELDSDLRRTAERLLHVHFAAPSAGR